MKDHQFYQKHQEVADAENFNFTIDGTTTIHHDKKAVLIVGDDSDVEVWVRVGDSRVDWTTMTDYVDSVGSGATKLTYVNIPFPCSSVTLAVTNDSGSAIQVSYYGGSA